MAKKVYPHETVWIF